MMPFQDNLVNWLSQDVGELVIGRNGVDADLTSLHIVTEVVELGSGAYFGKTRNFNGTTVVFKNNGPEAGTLKWCRLSSLTSRITMGILAERRA
jgi:hypothetical protein